MSSYFMDEVSKLATAEDSAGLSVHVCGIMLDLWQMSLTASKVGKIRISVWLQTDDPSTNHCTCFWVC